MKKTLIRLISAALALTAAVMLFSGCGMIGDIAHIGSKFIEYLIDGKSTETEAADNSPDSVGTVLSRICGLYRGENQEIGGEEVTDDVEIRYIGRCLTAEMNNKYDYSAMEIIPDDPSSLTTPYSAPIPVTLKWFSGFSYAGEYWDVPDRYEMELTGSGVVFRALDGGSDITLISDDSVPSYHDRNAIRENLGKLYGEGTALYEYSGEWECENENGYHYLQLDEHGGMSYVCKKDGRPVCAYIGAWNISYDSGYCVMLFERIGYGGMPADGCLDVELTEDGRLILRKTPEGSDLFHEDSLTMNPVSRG